MINNTNNFSLIDLMKSQREKRKAQRNEAREATSQHEVNSQLQLTAQTSRVNSQISTPRLTPLRLIERNRNTDKNDINRLEDKIKELENSICEAK